VTPDQRQKGGDASTNVQAGRDVTLYQGATLEEVREIALAVFQQNFLELRGLAEDIARARAEKITHDFLEEMQARAPLALPSASDPDMQRAIFEAQREYACSGDEDLEAVLVDLLVDRASETTRETRTIVLNEAIQAAPKLTTAQRRAIAVCFLVKYTRYAGPSMLEAYLQVYVKHHLAPLADGIPTKPSAYQHIAYVGAGSVGIGTTAFIEAIRRSGRGFFTRGVTVDELPEPIEGMADNRQLLIPCLREPTRMQSAAMSDDSLNALLKEIGEPDLEASLRQVHHAGGLSDDEIRQELVAAAPELGGMIDAWTNSDLSRLTLTTVGLAIGHGYWRRVTGGDAPLAIWVSD
jgi:hypothetical protein